MQEHLEARGWKQRSLSGFVQTAGPLWTRRTEDGWHYGFHCDERHLNPAGVVHGGALLTLLDHAVSTVAWEAMDRQPCVTVQLDSQFLAPARSGQFVEAHVQVEHKTRSLVFLRARLVTGDVSLLVGQAILKAVAG